MTEETKNCWVYMLKGIESLLFGNNHNSTEKKRNLLNIDVQEDNEFQSHYLKKEKTKKKE